MKTLSGKVAVVTGASRGVGKGVALGLGEAGATVYVTGRTTQEGTNLEGVSGTVIATAEEVTAMGGKGIAVECDHRDDAETEKLFQRVKEGTGRLDILVNNAWGGYERMEHDGEFTWFKPFWAAQKYIANAVYGAAKAAVDKMTADMAHEAAKYNIAAISLYPGLVRTERVLRDAEYFDMSNSEAPQFTGRVIAALGNDPNVMGRTGKVWVVAALAEEYGIQDVDGKQPRPVTLEEA